MYENEQGLEVSGCAGTAHGRSREFKPPARVEYDECDTSVFLAGTIEQNTATLWQKKFVQKVEDLSVAILNPRRDDWDPDWEQRARNPEFAEQVTWELDGLDKADVVVLYFEAGTRSPIALLELGKLAEKRPQDVVICCPEGFWRIGNVEMMAERHNMYMVDTFDKMVVEVRRRLESKGACVGRGGAGVEGTGGAGVSMGRPEVKIHGCAVA
jgi:hypothetical protein